MLAYVCHSTAKLCCFFKLFHFCMRTDRCENLVSLWACVSVSPCVCLYGVCVCVWCVCVYRVLIWEAFHLFFTASQFWEPSLRAILTPFCIQSFLLISCTSASQPPSCPGIPILVISTSGNLISQQQKGLVNSCLPSFNALRMGSVIYP